MPQYFSAGSAYDFTQWLGVVTENDGAVCVSKATADQLADWFVEHGPRRQRPFKIGWSHNGADIEKSAPTASFPPDASNVLHAIRSHPSFLMVGTIEPHRGYGQTLAAFNYLWREGLQLNLVVVGPRNWIRDKLIGELRSHPQLQKRLFWLEGISDECLGAIYAGSTCMIAASEGEGFGLPLIEAARHSLPIIARDTAVFREIAGEHAFYFTGKDSSALAAVIKQWLTLYAEDRHPKSDAMRWLSWTQSAERLQEILLGGDWYAVLSAMGNGSASTE
jgi:glycosyltransferase involved in cell wall biosynthesis